MQKRWEIKMVLIKKLTVVLLFQISFFKIFVSMMFNSLLDATYTWFYFVITSHTLNHKADHVSTTSHVVDDHLMFLYYSYFLLLLL